ncbi:DUF2971 domain-containing protein [Acinetobacter sp. 194]|uniref:DUF2971 domain-containing protein n=1 Tax=Acinetobacter shaoyimingii TaxID=2715164 RepID=UPI00140C5E0B|nr:DUF2971 domain-containing protein [Acinetobacter shaoyimingii]NHB56571.1 DUF2971 domain-containing protein [Acinetobacter shaoyimingii]
MDIKCDDYYYYIYKHLSFDRELKVLDLFKKLKLKFTPPDNFNDPYDCMAEIKFENIPIAHHEILQKHFSDAIRSNLSVTCFNNNPLNMLMWSHYAQSHKGFLVEFKIPHPIFEWVHDAFNFQPITYQDEFPTFPLLISDPLRFFKPEFSAEMLNFITNQYLVKAKDWEYEKEFRVLAHDYDKNNFDSLLKIIPSKYISSVILGAKLKDEDTNKSELLEAISYFNKTYQGNVKAYQAELKPNSFKIFVKGHPVLDRETKTLKDFLFPEML